MEKEWNINKKTLDNSLKKRKNKITSPSVRHLGIVKVCLQSDNIMTTIFHILKLEMSRNLVLDRWSHTSLLLLRKDDSSSHIDHFRHINIIERDLPWIITTIWARNLSSKCNDEKTLQPNQYAKKISSSEESILNKQMWLYLQILSVKEGVLFYYEAS